MAAIAADSGAPGVPPSAAGSLEALQYRPGRGVHALPGGRLESVAPRQRQSQFLRCLGAAVAVREVSRMDHVLHWVAGAIEALGALVIVGASLASLHTFLRAGLQRAWAIAYEHTRAQLGRGILLGLEFLVAADILDTIAVTPSYESLSVLALIIVIRTLLSFALQVEIDGRWPWRRAIPPRTEDRSG